MVGFSCVGNRFWGHFGVPAAPKWLANLKGGGFVMIMGGGVKMMLFHAQGLPTVFNLTRPRGPEIFLSPTYLRDLSFPTYPWNVVSRFHLICFSFVFCWALFSVLLAPIRLSHPVKQ